MTDQQLLDYIKQQRQQEKSKKEIKQELIAVGWEEKDIEEAFNMVNFAESSGASPSPLPGQEQAPSLSALPGVGDLLKRSFSVYRARLGTFVGIMLFPLIVGLLALVSPLLILINFPLGILFFIVFILIIMIAGIWSQVSLIFAIKDREEKIGIVESFKKGWHKMVSFVWVSFLASIIIMGGYLLFIIPGIIFSIWFAFSFYILVSEDLKGMNAIFRSKQLAAGHWWKILWRFFVMGVLISVPTILLYMIIVFGFSVNLADPIIRIISVLFITPFNFVFGFLLYEDLKRRKEQAVFEPPKKGTKIKFILIGIAGLLLIPAILASIALFSLGKARGRAQEARIMAVMNQLRVPVEMIYWEERSYSDVSCSHSELTYLCKDIKNSTGKEPIIHSSQDAYCIYVKLPSGNYYCFDDSSFTITETTIFPGNPGYCDGITFNCPKDR